MATTGLELIQNGTVPNDGTGDTPRASWVKQNRMNAELYGAVAAASAGAAAAMAAVTALGGRVGTVLRKPGGPVAADIPAGAWAIGQDTTTGRISIYANLDGALVDVLNGSQFG